MPRKNSLTPISAIAGSPPLNRNIAIISIATMLTHAQAKNTNDMDDSRGDFLKLRKKFFIFRRVVLLGLVGWLVILVMLLC